MTFKDIKQDYTLHLLDREKLEYSEVKVSSVGLPRFENKVGQAPSMVVDITVDVDGKPITYSFPDSIGKYYIGNVLVATSKDDIIADVKALCSSSERAIKEVDRHRDIVEKCHNLLADLDTTEKEKQATERRFSEIENSIGDIKGLLANIANKLNP